MIKRVGGIHENLLMMTCYSLNSMHYSDFDKKANLLALDILNNRIYSGVSIRLYANKPRQAEPTIAFSSNFCSKLS